MRIEHVGIFQLLLNSKWGKSLAMSVLGKLEHGI